MSSPWSLALMNAKISKIKYQIEKITRIDQDEDTASSSSSDIDEERPIKVNCKVEQLSHRSSSLKTKWDLNLHDQFHSKTFRFLPLLISEALLILVLVWIGREEKVDLLAVI